MNSQQGWPKLELPLANCPGSCGKIVEYDSTQKSRCTEQLFSSLLYGSETWTPYRCHIKKLDNFHMNCLRRISNTRWQDRLHNTEILDRCNITGIEAMLMQSQLRWCGHVHRMPDSRIPKQLLYGQLTGSTRSQGGQRKRYKDYLCLTLKSCDISNLTTTYLT